MREEGGCWEPSCDNAKRRQKCQSPPPIYYRQPKRKSAAVARIRFGFSSPAHDVCAKHLAARHRQLLYRSVAYNFPTIFYSLVEDG